MTATGRGEGALWMHWRDVVRRQPTKVVVIEADVNRKWTARALDRLADAFAKPLRELRPGSAIAFRLPNGAEWLALFLALQRAGLVALPLDAALPAEGCRETARRFRAAALYLDGAFHHVGGTPQRRPGVCCLKVTSGSSGEPKAIACRAEHLLADGRNVCRTMGIRAHDRNLAVIPFGHSYGLGNLVVPLSVQGTALVCAREYLPRQLVDWTRRHRVTVFPGVPALFRVLAALPSSAGNLTPLRTAISAGAVLPPAVAQAFQARFGLKVHNFYGSSETGGICYDRAGATSLSGRSVGRPLRGVTVQVKARRIIVSGAAVATATGRWRLADLGEWNPRGELVLLGRVGHGANIGGKKVHPREVERVIRALPGVTDATVWLARRDGRDLLAAAVETTHARGEIERLLAAQLPAWQLPRHLRVAAELPRTARGKLDLVVLRKLAG